MAEVRNAVSVLQSKLVKANEHLLAVDADKRAFRAQRDKLAGLLRGTVEIVEDCMYPTATEKKEQAYIRANIESIHAR